MHIPALDPAVELEYVLQYYATLLVDIEVADLLADPHSLVSELNINEEVSPRARLIYILDHPLRAHTHTHHLPVVSVI